MAELRQKSSDEKSGEAMMMEGAALGVFALLIKFLVPVVIGVVLSPLLCLGLRGPPLKQKLKPFGMMALNLAFSTYLFVGLPFLLPGKKEQFQSIFGEYAFKFAAYVIVTWNAWVKTSELGFFKKSAFIQHVTWRDVSQRVWGGVALGLIMTMVFVGIHHWNQSKKDGEQTRTLEGRIRQPSLNLLGQVLCLPASFILKWLIFKPAHEGHEYALSVRAKAFGFLQRMMIEVVLYSLLCIPFFFLPDRFTDLATLVSILLLFPLSAIMIAFIMGLLPGAGDALNQVVFKSPYEGDANSERNPFRKPSPPTGFVLGKSLRGANYLLTERNLNHHVQIVAPSGGGKTNILKNLISDRILKGHGVIFLDYKADFEVAEFIYQTANAVEREDEVRVFSLSNREISVPYNPVSHGSAAELQSRLMNAFNWSTEIYYRSKAESALLKIFRGLCELRDQGLQVITLRTVYEVLTKKGYARELAIELKDLGGKSAQALEEIAAMLDRPSEAKDMQGLITNLEKVIYSGAGELLTDDAGEKSFTIEEAIESGLITYFLMNSLSSKETATTVGKLLLQDLMGYVGRAYEKEAGDRKPVTIIIDEFAEFAIPEFPSFLNRVRGAGINVVIAHQTRSDLKAVSPDYQNKIEANTNTKIVAGVTDPEDAQFYAQMIGTQTNVKKTHQVQEEGIFFVTETQTGMKSVREVEEFIIHPNRIKRIEQGEALVISRTVDTGFGIVGVPRARSFVQGSMQRSEVESALTKTRQLYLNKIPGLKVKIAQQVAPSDRKTVNIWE
jgi:hypothetical protein